MPNLLRTGSTRGPDFICVGAQKGGTRWLFDQLNRHPDFWMPAIKELHYFNENIHVKWAGPLHRKARRNLARLNRKLTDSSMRALNEVDVRWLEALIWLREKPLDYDLYARLFNPRGDRRSGDITPTYSIIAPDKVRAARQRFPEARIIFIAREPIERFWSHYRMIAGQQNWRNVESLDTVEHFIQTGSGLRHSSVSRNVARWRDAGPSDTFGLFFFDDLKADAAGFRRDVIAFLGGDPGKPSGDLPPSFNRKGKDAPARMSEAVRARLVELLGDDIRQAAADLGGPAAAWPQKYGL
ncbi:sulfotransferase [Bauldia sp.]|uniref:sulfotransferase n=1 Tax=Bauldia sp. TaxID=2575872 RepID=UPI003BADA4E0